MIAAVPLGCSKTGEHAAWDTIVSIERLPAEDVYDIEVEGTHNFIGNDIIAHNTAIFNGNVGIGPSFAQGYGGQGTTTMTHRLNVDGDVGAIGFVNTSTRHLKTDIEYASASSTEDMLDRLESLKIAKYHYKIENQNDPLRIVALSPKRRSRRHPRFSLQTARASTSISSRPSRSRACRHLQTRSALHRDAHHLARDAPRGAREWLDLFCLRFSGQSSFQHTSLGPSGFWCICPAWHRAVQQARLPRARRELGRERHIERGQRHHHCRQHRRANQQFARPILDQSLCHLQFTAQRHVVGERQDGRILPRRSFCAADNGRIFRLLPRPNFR